MELAQSAKEPYNYFLLLRALFRSIGGGSHDLLYQEFLPLLPNLLQGKASLHTMNCDMVILGSLLMSNLPFPCFQVWTCSRVAFTSSIWRIYLWSCAWQCQCVWAPCCPTYPCWWIRWCLPLMALRLWSVRAFAPWSCVWTTSSLTSSMTTFSLSGQNSCRLGVVLIIMTNTCATHFNSYWSARQIPKISHSYPFIRQFSQYYVAFVPSSGRQWTWRYLQTNTKLGSLTQFYAIVKIDSYD